MRGILSLIVSSAVLQACCGCLASPNFSHPGTEECQQARARVFEPYPDNDAGPPVAGARPREYQEPRPAFAELQDMQRPRPGEPILAPCPQSQVPQMPIDQPPIVTAPPAIYVPPTATP